jgi:hypothetical protein
MRCSLFFHNYAPENKKAALLGGFGVDLLNFSSSVTQQALISC